MGANGPGVSAIEREDGVHICCGVDLHPCVDGSKCDGCIRGVSAEESSWATTLELEVEGADKLDGPASTLINDVIGLTARGLFDGLVESVSDVVQSWGAAVASEGHDRELLVAGGTSGRGVLSAPCAGLLVDLLVFSELTETEAREGRGSGDAETVSNR